MTCMKIPAITRATGRWLIVFGWFLAACDGLGQEAPKIDVVSPGHWPKAELDRYLSLESNVPAHSEAVSSRGMIVGTAHPFAIHAGLEVLKHKGGAADAALTTALTQIALNAGAAYSYAGIMNAVYFDAAAGKVYTLNANYNTVQNEKEPSTIPRREPSGRTAMVPGSWLVFRPCATISANFRSLRCLLPPSGLQRMAFR